MSTTESSRVPASQPEASDFQTTRRTWIAGLVSHGLQRDALRYVMEVYALPLQAYAARSRYRWLSEPADLVHGFFAQRLAKEGYLERWREDGRPLRDWLRTGLHLWMRKQARDLSLARSREQEVEHIEAEDEDPVEVMERAFVDHILRLALQEAAEECRRGGLELQWRAFSMRCIEGKRYAEIARELGVTEYGAVIRARAPRVSFRRRLRSILERDGVPAERVNPMIEEWLRGRF